jgi:hypothetical protein
MSFGFVGGLTISRDDRIQRAECAGNLFEGLVESRAGRDHHRARLIAVERSPDVIVVRPVRVPMHILREHLLREVCLKPQPLDRLRGCGTKLAGLQIRPRQVGLARTKGGRCNDDGHHDCRRRPAHPLAQVSRDQTSRTKADLIERRAERLTEPIAGLPRAEFDAVTVYGSRRIHPTRVGGESGQARCGGVAVDDGSSRSLAAANRGTADKAPLRDGRIGAFALQNRQDPNLIKFSVRAFKDAVNVEIAPALSHREVSRAHHPSRYLALSLSAVRNRLRLESLPMAIEDSAKRRIDRVCLLVGHARRFYMGARP